MVEGFEKWLVNVSFSQSAVRNQGKGILRGIQYELVNNFSVREFFDCLTASNSKYQIYLNRLAEKLNGKPGLDPNYNPTNSQITWGAARKCINLLARTVVYNAFIWKGNNIKASSFKTGGIMNNLELPLDSYSVKGIIEDCSHYGITIPNSLYTMKFTIKHLTPIDSSNFQKLAAQIAQKRKTCRIHLDIIYWRRKFSAIE